MSSYQRKATPGDTEWFVHDRFGMFIHFGTYALAGRHEWVKYHESTPDDVYEDYKNYFNPDLFDAKEWAKRAKDAGMKYAVLTAKHHEGFCLFDTQYTDYKITNTPFGRDLVKEYAEAFREAGLRVGLYYSLLDWHHPEYPIDSCHPRRHDPDAEEKNKTRDVKKYAEYMRNQVRELLTNYGKIDVIWFDFSWEAQPDPTVPASVNRGKGKDDWEAEKLIALARSLQPGIIIDNRTGIEQDIVTPEQYQPSEWPRDEKTGEYLTWEACQTFSGSWGYYRDELTWKSPRMLLEMLIRTVSVGGNLLMNVGPCARGYFDERACAALDVYAEWMRYNERSIRGCTMAEPEFVAPNGTLLTQSEDGKRLYIHLLSYPYKQLRMDSLFGKCKYAQFLHDASQLLTSETQLGVNDLPQAKGDTFYLNLPEVAPKTEIPVIEVFLK